MKKRKSNLSKRTAKKKTIGKSSLFAETSSNKTTHSWLQDENVLQFVLYIILNVFNEISRGLIVGIIYLSDQSFLNSVSSLIISTKQFVLYIFY